MEIKKILEIKARECDGYLQEYLSALTDNITPLYEAVKYSVGAGGKRLRMIALLESARLFNDDVKEAIPFACAAEFIHTYSLIHDDLPAMDDADFRRSKPSCHKQFGECVAILAGDALLHYAFEIMSSRPYINALHEIAKYSGIGGMVLGQAYDTLLKEPPDLETLKFIYKNKTSSMYIGPMKAGAITAGAYDESLKKIEAFAENFGIAFQIIDDIIDVTKDIETTGKLRGADVKAGKTTAASLLGLADAREYAEILMDVARENIAPLDRFGFFCGLCDYIINQAD